jgi:hypothetical protein
VLRRITYAALGLAAFVAAAEPILNIFRPGH